MKEKRGKGENTFWNIHTVKKNRNKEIWGEDLIKEIWYYFDIDILILYYFELLILF